MQENSIQDSRCRNLQTHSREIAYLPSVGNWQSFFRIINYVWRKNMDCDRFSETVQLSTETSTPRHVELTRVRCEKISRARQSGDFFIWKFPYPIEDFLCSLVESHILMVIKYLECIVVAAMVSMPSIVFWFLWSLVYHVYAGWHRCLSISLPPHLTQVVSAIAQATIVFKIESSNDSSIVHS